MTIRMFAVSMTLVLIAPIWVNADEVEKLLTVAETSDYKATSRHAEVIDFCERLAKLSPLVKMDYIGASVEKRRIPLLILADPPVANAEEARKSKKLVVLAQGNIHAGEIDGKEALLMLARDMATAKERPLLKDLIVCFIPIVNPDGNEKFGKHRPEQNGPDEVGIRANAEGLDLNRDFTKLESPEVRALARFYADWQPAMVIDTHTTNGSFHRYTLTYDGPRHPAAHEKLIGWTRDALLPAAGKGLAKQTGFKSFIYGDFSKDHQRWEPYAPLPRYGTQYVGMRHIVGVLSESYSYASYRDRVIASRGFVTSCFELAAKHKDDLRKIVNEAGAADIQAGADPDKHRIVLRQKMAALRGKFTVQGFVEIEKDGKTMPTDKHKDYEVDLIGSSEPTLTVRRPYAYVFPAELAKVIANLQRHGITVESLTEEGALEAEIYRIDKIAKRKEAFQKHYLVTLECTARAEARRAAAGSILVRTNQTLGTLACFLLEPQSEDGLCTWNYFDDSIAEGKDFPVLRILKKVDLKAKKIDFKE